MTPEIFIALWCVFGFFVTLAAGYFLNGKIVMFDLPMAVGCGWAWPFMLLVLALLFMSQTKFWTRRIL